MILLEYKPNNTERAINRFLTETGLVSFNNLPVCEICKIRRVKFNISKVRVSRTCDSKECIKERRRKNCGFKNMTHEQRSEVARRRSKKLIAEGRHCFQNLTEEQKNRRKEKTRIKMKKNYSEGKLGICHLTNEQKSKAGLNSIKTRIKKYGKAFLNYSSEQLSEKSRNIQLNLSKEGKHPFQTISNESITIRTNRGMKTKLSRGDKRYFSKQENDLLDLFIKKGIKLIKQFNIKGSTHHYDAYLSDYNLIIEYDGTYWHQGREELDKKNTNFALENGYSIIRINDKVALSKGFENLVTYFIENDFNLEKINNYLGDNNVR